MAPDESTPTPHAAPAPLRCAACDYNLTGIAEPGVCPECGLSITSTRAGRRLSHADPGWLTQLRTGSFLVLLAAAIAAGTAIGTLMLAFGLRGSQVAEPVFSIGLLIAAVVACRGWWLMTRAEPGAPDEPRRHTLGFTIRISIALAAVAILLERVLVQGFAWFGMRSASEVVSRANVLVVGVAGLVHFTTAIWFFAALAERAGDRRWARVCRRWGVLCAACWVVGGAKIATGLEFPGSGRSFVSSTVGLLFIVLQIIGLFAMMSAPGVYWYSALLLWRRAKAIHQERENTIPSEPRA